MKNHDLKTIILQTIIVVAKPQPHLSQFLYYS